MVFQQLPHGCCADLPGITRYPLSPAHASAAKQASPQEGPDIPGHPKGPHPITWIVTTIWLLKIAMENPTINGGFNGKIIYKWAILYDYVK